MPYAPPTLDELTPAERTAVDLALKAATLEGEGDRVCFLGPFARRVSFAAQQNRALNLVWALHLTGRLAHGQPVAVVGAGLAGLMAAAALKALKQDVYLFDARGEVLAHQLGTRHRLIHPTINLWPDDPELNPTTTLPYFDWAASPCSAVLGGVFEEWKDMGAEAMRQSRRLLTSHKVKHYMPTNEGVTLETEPTVDLPLFGTVIYATGFEVERTIKNVPKNSYWDDDQLVTQRLQDRSLRFIVSGTGDGGLIDALRLAFEGFADGALAMRLATILGDGPSSVIVRDAEQTFLKGKRRGVDEGELRAKYLDALKAMPPAARQYLQDALVKYGAPLVTLLGIDETLLGRDAAPIHKLMALFASERGRIEYTEGAVTVTARRQVFLKPKGKARIPRSGAVVVIRHGAEPALTRLLKSKGAAFKKLRSNQLALMDSLITPFWMGGWAEIVGQPPHDPKDGRFVKSRLFRARLISNIWTNLHVTPGEHGFDVEAPDETCWLPRTLFGVPVSRLPSHPETEPL